MFYYIEGVVTVLEKGAAVIDAGGVGFLINVSLNTLGELRLDSRARLYTYSSIREDAFDIYGFYTKAEKRSFELLISVSGVGPKAALSILSKLTPEGLAMSIISEDEKPLISVPGIGKRTAQRIIVDLKDKMAKEDIAAGLTSAAIPSVADSKNVSEAAAALAVLGYTSAEITKALSGADVSGMDTENIIRYVLKNS